MRWKESKKRTQYPPLTTTEIHTHVYIHAHSHTHVHSHTHTCITLTHTHACTLTQTCPYTQTHTCPHAHMFSANTKEGNKVSETINNSRTEGTLPKMCKNYSKQPEEADMGVDFSTLGQWAEEMRNGNPTLPSNTVTSKLYRAVTRLGAPPTHTHTGVFSPVIY